VYTADNKSPKLAMYAPGNNSVSKRTVSLIRWRWCGRLLQL